ncbi:MAG: hypothetical protein AAF982_08735 [Pseudomonadota bacterium]
MPNVYYEIDHGIDSRDAVIHIDHLHSHGQFVVACGQHSVAVLVKNGKVSINHGPNNPLEHLSTRDVNGPDGMAERLKEAGFRPLKQGYQEWRPVYADWVSDASR